MSLLARELNLQLLSHNQSVSTQHSFEDSNTCLGVNVGVGNIVTVSNIYAKTCLLSKSIYYILALKKVWRACCRFSRYILAGYQDVQTARSDVLEGALHTPHSHHSISNAISLVQFLYNNPTKEEKTGTVRVILLVQIFQWLHFSPSLQMFTDRWADV